MRAASIARAALARLESKLAPPPASKPCGPFVMLSPRTGRFESNDGRSFPTMEDARAAYPPENFSSSPVFIRVVRSREELEAIRAAEGKAAP